MKKIIPFVKDIPFDTMIGEITDIEVTHDLKINNNIVDGSFIVNGKYKMTDASQLEEEFNYNLPFTINIDDKYNLNESNIRINDFYFEIVNEDILRINVELELDNMLENKCSEESEIDRCYDSDENVKEDYDSAKLDSFNDVITPLEVSEKDNNSKNSLNMADLFSLMNEEEDTFSTYYVYVVKENDTLDSIISKYKISKEDLLMYNNLDDIKNGAKLIIPCPNE